MIGQSEAFLASVRLIEKIGRWDAPVLIEGETGTGKELAARAIHYGGDRHAGPFIPVNCGAIPDSLIENELFGHKGGAYTDARRDQPGLVTLAQGGTLFLDEVDALSPKAQVTLLRFLQDRQYRQLGGSATHTADVRLITATNADLPALTCTGAFRLDLMYRIRLLHMRLPPLRARGGDVLLLADHILATLAARFGEARRLDPPTRAWLPRHAWPGNVRELENVITRGYMLADGANIHIPPPDLPDDDVVDRRWDDLPGRLFPPPQADPPRAARFREAKNAAMAAFERVYLASTLASAGGNVTHAARIAGKERRAFGKLLKKHGISAGPVPTG
ncbi:MAG: sigma-54-dependent Fis family transcriptional regulator [Proteobacteria bacterium]|nr:sigma-54-dependent Fis family transcriptional regulator [Pseudomonadota bacterium]